MDADFRTGVLPTFYRDPTCRPTPKLIAFPDEARRASPSGGRRADPAAWPGRPPRGGRAPRRAGRKRAGGRRPRRLAGDRSGGARPGPAGPGRAGGLPAAAHGPARAAHPDADRPGAGGRQGRGAEHRRRRLRHQALRRPRAAGPHRGPGPALPPRQLHPAARAGRDRRLRARPRSLHRHPRGPDRAPHRARGAHPAPAVPEPGAGHDPRRAAGEGLGCLLQPADPHGGHDHREPAPEDRARSRRPAHRHHGQGRGLRLGDPR